VKSSKNHFPIVAEFVINPGVGLMDYGHTCNKRSAYLYKTELFKICIALGHINTTFFHKKSGSFKGEKSVYKHFLNIGKKCKAISVTGRGGL
jgi:hypothetical protein